MTTDFSQDGEQGIIARLVEELPEMVRTRACIEFGAADGLFFSNTAALWHDGYAALLIEADELRYVELLRNTSGYPAVRAEHALVQDIDHFTTEPHDVISIDIDGDDYHVFDRMQTKHRIVCIEHNPMFPPEVEAVNPPGGRLCSSALSLVKLARSKGYTLQGATLCNLIFGWAEIWPVAVPLEEVFNRSCLVNVICDQDGNWTTIGMWPWGRNQEKPLL